MTSSDRLPPAPLMFTGATRGTENNQDKHEMAIITVHLHQEEVCLGILPFKISPSHMLRESCIFNENKLCLHISKFLRERTQLCLIHEHPGSKIN
jgi:hypothetical protein